MTMRAAYFYFTSAFGYSQCVVALRAGVVSVVFILKLSYLFDYELLPWLNDLKEFCIFSLSCRNIFRQSTPYNNDIRNHPDVMKVGYINKRQYTRNYAPEYHQSKIKHIIAVSSIHKLSELFHHRSSLPKINITDFTFISLIIG